MYVATYVVRTRSQKIKCYSLESDSRYVDIEGKGTCPYQAQILNCEHRFEVFIDFSDGSTVVVSV